MQFVEFTIIVLTIKDLQTRISCNFVFIKVTIVGKDSTEKFHKLRRCFQIIRK